MSDNLTSEQVNGINAESFLDNAESLANEQREQRQTKRLALLENTAIWSRKVDSENQPALYDDGNMRFAVVVRVTPAFQPEKYRHEYTIAHIRSVVYNPVTGKSNTENLGTVYALGVMGYDSDKHALTLASHGESVIVHSNQSGAIRKSHDMTTLAGSIAIVKKAHKIGFGVNADSVGAYVASIADSALDTVEIAESIDGFTI